MAEDKLTLPCIPIHFPIYFPGIEALIKLEFNEKFKELIEQDPRIVIMNTKDPDGKFVDKNLEDFGMMGTAVNIGREGNVLNLTTKLDSRVRMLKFGLQEFEKVNILFAECEIVPEKIPSADEFLSQDFQLKIHSILAHAAVLLSDQKDLIKKVFSVDKLNEETTGQLIDILAYEFNFLPSPRNPAYLREIAKEPDVAKRVNNLYMLFWGCVIGSVSRKPEFEDTEKESLGAEDAANTFRKLYDRTKKNLPKEVKKIVRKETEKLSRMQPYFHEYSTVSIYLEQLLKFPWNKYTQDNTDIEQMNKILDEDHYGLAKPKNRVVEYTASRILNPRKKAPILCFIGPPGTGKTSLGKSIARALGRKFARISLGGVNDESEIRGHRRTFVGSLPGKIVDAISRSGSLNPVLMIDEIDKLGKGPGGDPASALLEVLDPEQNHAFRDHYMDVGVDLSQVLFVLTANLKDPIPQPLHDRMEIIYFTSYTENEKIHIAEKFLVPKKLKEAGLDPESTALTEKGFEKIKIEILKDALSEIINEYTAEAGVRGLERKIDDVLRKIVRKILERKSSRQPEDEEPISEKTDPAVWEINKDNINRYLDKTDKKTRETALKTDLRPGVVPMVVVSSAGGSILYCEAAYRKNVDHRKIKVTGVDPFSQSVGKTIEESADVAWNFLFKEGGILSKENIPENIYLHIHLTDGGTPKDGTSGGIALLWLLYSLFTDQPIKPGLVPTGEITLALGGIAPIGAVKEKILGAIRANAKEILIPLKNMPDVEDILEDIEGKIKIVPCETMVESLKIALPNCPRLHP